MTVCQTFVARTIVFLKKLRLIFFYFPFFFQGIPLLQRPPLRGQHHGAPGDKLQAAHGDFESFGTHKIISLLHSNYLQLH